MHFEAYDLCVSQVAVELYTNLYATPRYRLNLPTSEQPVFRPFSLAENEDLRSSSRAAHEQRVRDLVFTMAEKIAVDIRLANQ